MRTESEIKEMIHRIGNNPNLIGAGEKKALEWVLDVEGSAMSSNAVLGDEPPLTDIGLCELELIACYDGGVYWFLDYRFRDDSGGAFLNSQIYKDDKAAIFALISGTIKWSECHTEK